MYLEYLESQMRWYDKLDFFLIEDGKLMADAEAGEFWALFGGFAPLPKKSPSEDSREESEIVVKLLR